MTNSTNIQRRKLHGKYVDPRADQITVHLLDWTKVNKNITTKIHQLHTDLKDHEYEVKDGYDGFINQNGNILVINRDCMGFSAKMHEGETCLTVRMQIYKKPKDGFVSNYPDFHMNITIDTINNCMTGVDKNLPDFMDIRYKYNDRICDNEYKIINMIND